MIIPESLRLPVAAAALAVTASPALAQWSTDTLSTRRTDHAATSLDTRAFFGHGRIHPSVDVYNDATGTWSVHNTSIRRSYPTATSVGQYAFFAGGIESGTWQDNADVYDASTDSWSFVTCLSERRSRLTSTSVGTKALFAGGKNGSGASNVVDIYDSALGPPADPNAWSTTTLSVARYDLTATTVGPYALFAGGTADDNGATTYDTVDVYDDSTGTWSTANLSQARRWVGAASNGGRAFFAGGEDCCDYFREIDVYDSTVGPPTDPTAWTVDLLTMERSTVSVAAVGSLVLFAGGENFPNQLDVVEVFDTASGLWSTDRLSMRRSSVHAATVGEKVLFGGGFNIVQGPFLDDVEIYELDFGVRYCSPAVSNSSGSPTELRIVGSTSVSRNELTLQARSLPPGSFGFFLTSLQPGLVNQPSGSQGVLCLGNPIGRYVGPGQILNSGTAGTFELMVDLSQHPTPTGLVQVAPGERWNFQCWHRDQVGGTATSNLSDAVSLTFQ